MSRDGATTAAAIKVLLTHPGTQYSYQLARQLERLGLLYCFATGIAFGENNILLKWLPKAAGNYLRRRHVSGVPEEKILRIWKPELIALKELKSGGMSVLIHAKRNKVFQQKIPDQLIRSVDVVIGFDSSSLILLERCKKLGKQFILDGSIAHPISQQKVFDKLRIKYPAWTQQLPVKPADLISAELAEMEKADHIVLASDFSAATYREHGVDPQKITVNHYGLDTSYFHSKWDKDSAPVSPLRYLSFGQVSARKGFPWLADVWRMFYSQARKVSLTAAGYGQPPLDFDLPEGIQLAGYIHPADRLQLFHSADVFVFPSFFEGFAQVIIEAMACGLPVITTTATVGPELIEHGVTGFLVEPGDDAALLKALKFFADNPNSVSQMGKKARERVESMTWEAYGNRWGEVISFVMNRKVGYHQDKLIKTSL